MTRLKPDDSFYDHLPSRDLSPEELASMGIDGSIPERGSLPDNGEAVLPPVRQVTVTPPESINQPEQPEDRELGPPLACQPSYNEFMTKWGKSEVASKGTYVYGKKIQSSVASRLAKDAVAVIRNEFTVFELVKLVSNGGLSLENYFGTLQSIRDDPDASPKDRMAANDKILNATLSITKTFADREGIEELDSLGDATRDKSDVDSTKGLLLVLANVQGASKEPIQAGKHGSPTLTELIPEATDVDTTNQSRPETLPTGTSGPTANSDAPTSGTQ